MGVSKTSDPIQIKIKMPNPNQEPPYSSKAQNEDLMDMDDLCISKIKIEIKNLDHRSTKDQCPIQIKIKMPNPSQEPPGSSEAPNQQLMDNDIREYVFFKLVCLKSRLVYG